MPSWLDRYEGIAQVAAKQLFFVGGAPRSGTTWLQRILDAHPDVACQGEALFMNHFTVPLEGIVEKRRQILREKNIGLFAHTGGYPLPPAEDTEFLGATAILLGFAQQAAAKPCLAVGEKTPENVFFFERLQAMFPGSKFIGIARDPRDVLTSAWHFFHKAAPGQDEAAAKIAFIQTALPSINHGARTMLSLRDRFPQACAIVTYEQLRRDPAPAITRLYRLLGVSDSPQVVEAALAKTAFETSTGGRPNGVEQRGSFFRKGVAGDWATTLTPEMNALVLRETEWMFPAFGWPA